MSHFLLALIVLALSVLVVVEAWSSASGRARPVDPAWFRYVVLWAGLAACRSTRGHGRRRDGVGPASGVAEGVERLGLPITDTVYVHVRVAAAFGIGFLVLGFVSAPRASAYPGRSGSGSVRSSCSWRSRSWARCSTATLFPGGSCSPCLPRRDDLGPCGRAHGRPLAHPALRAARRRPRIRPLGQRFASKSPGWPSRPADQRAPHVAPSVLIAAFAAGTTAARPRRLRRGRSRVSGCAPVRRHRPRGLRRLPVDPAHRVARRGADAAIEWPDDVPGSRDPGADRDAVILISVDELRWRAYNELVIGLARDLGVELVVTLGALFADVAPRGRRR